MRAMAIAAMLLAGCDGCGDGVAIDLMWLPFANATLFDCTMYDDSRSTYATVRLCSSLSSVELVEVARDLLEHARPLVRCEATGLVAPCDCDDAYCVR